MSSGRKLDVNTVWPIAAEVVVRLAGATERIEIAGSLRRGSKLVSDVEIVCVPKTVVERDLFGMKTGERCYLAETVRTAVDAGWLRWRTETHPTPPKDWREPRRVWSLVVAGEMLGDTCGTQLDVPLDLFAVRPPAQWGAIFAIRTGPHAFSQRLVTDCRERGLRCVDGHLERIGTGATVATPEERDFLAACGSPWVEPGDRR